MCWNETVSLNTYIVAVFGTVFALMNGAPTNVILWFHIFSIMQLVEYFIWKNINNPNWNHVFSSLGLLVLAIEPIASMFLMNKGPLRNKFLIAYILFLLGIFYIYYPWIPYTEVAENGHLKWFWQGNMPFYINIIWLIFFIGPILIAKYYWLAIFGIVTVLISIFTYKKYGTWGTMWCWMANGLWLILIGFIASDKCFQDLLCKK